MDPATGVIWRANLKPAPRLESVNVPDDDTITDFLPMKDDVTGEAKLLALGELGAYRFDGEDFVPDELDWPRFGKRVSVEKSDLLAPTAIIRNRNGAELYRHHYGLLTGAEKREGIQIFVASLLRAPLTHLLSWFGPEAKVDTPKERRAVLDPFTAAGQRPGSLRSVSCSVPAWASSRCGGFGSLVPTPAVGGSGF